MNNFNGPRHEWPILEALEALINGDPLAEGIVRRDAQTYQRLAMTSDVCGEKKLRNEATYKARAAP